MKIKIDTAYLTNIDGVTYYLRFQPVNNIPCYTHKIWISDNKKHNGKPVNYLHENFKPSKKNAEFYLSKHVCDGKILSRKEITK